jgi:hypothetical protein
MTARDVLLVILCTLGGGVLAVHVLAWIWKVPRGDDDDFKSGGRPFNPRGSA